MKITGLTKDAYNCLSMDDIDFLESCISNDVEHSKEEPEMLVMRDGSLTHESFLKIK